MCWRLCYPVHPALIWSFYGFSHLDAFLVMGSHRLLLWSAILAPILTFAEWSQSDSAFLQSISVNVAALKTDSDTSLPVLNSIASDVSSMELYFQSWDQLINGISLSVDVLPSIATDVESIESDADYIRQYSRSIDSNLVDACLSLQSISELLDDILTDMSKFEFSNQSSQVEHYNHRSVYVHDVRTDDIDYKLGLFGSALTNQLNVLDSTVNNLTNFLCYSSSYVESFTNFSAEVAYYGFNPNYIDSGTARILFQRLYGYNPSSSELTNFTKYLAYDRGIEFCQDLLSDVPNLPIFKEYDYSFGNSPGNAVYYTWRNFESVQGTAGLSTSSRNNVKAAGVMRYLAYGTRDLTDTTIAISNSMFATTGDFLTHNSSSSGSSWSLGSTASSALHGIKESVSFTGTVGTNVVGTVLEGPINHVVDNDFNSSLNEIKQSSPASFTDLDGVLAEINGVKGTADDIVNMLDNADHDDDYVISGEIAMPHIGTHTLSLTIPNQSARMGPIVNFFCVCMEFFMLVYFCSVAWDDIVQVVFGRRVL